MKCMICNKDYIALGVHIKLAHKCDLDVYRDDFGLMRTAALVDDDLSRRISKAAKERLMDPDYKQEIMQRMRSDAFVKSGKHYYGMSKAGKENLALRNKKRGDEYLEGIAGEVKKILDECGTMIDVTRKLGVGRETVLKLIGMGKVQYDLHKAKDIRKERARNGLKAKVLPGI